MGAVSTVVVIVLAALAVWYWWPGRAEAIDSIAVLPLDNLSGDEEQDIWADGVTAELISNFKKVGALETVISRSTAMRYKDTNKTPREIADELGVKVILHGTFQKIGTRVRITAELINGRTEELIWSDTFNGRTRDILNLQSEIPRSIMEEIELVLTPEETEILTVERTVDEEAYVAYLKGRNYEKYWKSEQRAKALESFQSAIQLDSTFVEAYAWLAFCYATGEIGGTKDLDQAWKLANKALELDPRSALAHEARGWCLLNRDYDWDGALREMEEAQRLAPGDDGIQIHGIYNLAGRNEKAIELAERGARADPLDYHKHQTLCFTYMTAGRPDDAIEHYRTMLERFADDEDVVKTAWEWMAYAYTQTGLPDSAFAIARREGLDTSDWHLWDWVYAAAGLPDSAMRHLEEFKAYGEDTATITGFLYGLGGRRDEAFEWLNIACDERATWLLFINNMSAFGCYDSLLADPRWDELTARVGFPEGNWKRRPIWIER